MSIQLVLGAGEIGRPLVHRLIERGDDVRIATRSGATVAGAAAVRLDAADPDAVARAADGAATIFLCTNPPYQDWPRAWPPIFAAVIDAARRSGAALVAMGNLYPYGRVTAPMTEDSVETTSERKGLVRKAGWAALRGASESGAIRAVEVRASDYFGAGAGATAQLGERFFGPLLAGKTAMVVGDPAQLHSWSYLPDIVSALVAASDHDGPWSRVWHVPSHARTRVGIAEEVGTRTGLPSRVVGYPSALLSALGVFSPFLREVAASSYQFRDAPFVIDATETSALLAVGATPWEDALETTLASYRSITRRGR
ncbi:NAD-dependent epimerase/dehydratase family protein [Pseudolysinimonas sp.]|uniref:NAD-dependent epimerase/dehydratase family protein n=1 Tax=Pseudolysinimonas sp. TaxID=2680009 RepID=UPI003784254F